MEEKNLVKLNNEEFIQQVGQEFGIEWEDMRTDIQSQTGADRVVIKKDILATKLSREGYLVTPFIGRTRFLAKLLPEDVGLDPQNEDHKAFISHYLALGSKNLIPNDILAKLNQIESKIRRIIDSKYGIPTVQGSFVCYKNLDALKNEIELLKAEYFAIRDKILTDYDEIIKETSQAYQTFAPEVFRLLHKDPAYQAPEEDIDSFVTRTMARFPSKETIIETFKVEITYGVFPGTTFLVEQEARLSLVREREKIYQAQLAVIDRELSEDKRIQAERERQRLLVEREQAKTLLAQETMKQRAIEDAYAQARRDYDSQLGQTFADLYGAVHGIIFDAVTKVSESVQTHGSLSPGSSRSLGHLLDQIETLRMDGPEHPDRQLDEWVNKIKIILDTPSTKRDQLSVKTALAGIRTQAAQIIVGLGEVPRTLRDINVTMEQLEAIAVEEPVRTVRNIRQLDLNTESQALGELVRSTRRVG